MDQQPEIISDKAAQARGSVHRPENNDAGPSSSPRHARGNSDMAQQSSSTAASHHQHQPPPYSGPSTSAADSRRPVLPKGPQHYPGLPVLDYRQYAPPMFELSADGTTITSKATYLSENARALSSLMRTLATVPPKPQIVVHGTRGRRVDFSIRLNLMSLLVPPPATDAAGPRRMEYLRCVARDEMAYRGGNAPSLKPDLTPRPKPGPDRERGEEEGEDEDELEAWCARYVADASAVKTFTLERVVANLDQAWLEGQIRSLVAATGYRGLVAVRFPVTHARVTVQSPDKVNKFFTSVTALFAGKARYEVVRAVWPFADARNGQLGRTCAVQSESTWWEEWRDPIKYAISQKRQGWVTNEDKLECIMESKANKALVDWGPDEDHSY